MHRLACSIYSLNRFVILFTMPLILPLLFLISFVGWHQTPENMLRRRDILNTRTSTYLFQCPATPKCVRLLVRRYPGHILLACSVQAYHYETTGTIFRSFWVREPSGDFLSTSSRCPTKVLASSESICIQIFSRLRL